MNDKPLSRKIVRAIEETFSPYEDNPYEEIVVNEFLSSMEVQRSEDYQRMD
jgi:hypothetical protein